MDSPPRNVNALSGAANATKLTKEKAPFPFGMAFSVCLVSYMLYKVSGQTFITFASKVLLLLITILFVWAKAATVVNRPLPPIPKMNISQEMIHQWETVVCEFLNKVLLGFENVALGKDTKLFCIVAISLWLISFVDSFTNFVIVESGRTR